MFCQCVFYRCLHMQESRCCKDMLSCREQASTQLDALGDHQKLYNELTQAEAQQRKLTQEQVSMLPGILVL